MAKFVSHKIYNKSYNLKAESAMDLDETEYSVEVQPDNNTTTNVFQSSVYLDYTLTREVHKWRKLELLMSITTAANISLVPAAAMLDRVQVWIGTELVEEITGWNALIDTWTIQEDDISINYAGDIGGFNGVTFGAANVINTTTALRAVRLPTLFDTIKPVVAAWPDMVPIRIRIYFASGASLVVAGPGTISNVSLASSSIRVHGWKLTRAAIEKESSALYAAGKLSYRFLRHSTQSIVTSSITSGNQAQFQMIAVNGPVAWITVTLRNTNPVGAQVVTPLQWTSFQINNASGTNMLGINLITDAYLRLAMIPDWFRETDVYRQLFLYTYSWSSSPKAAWVTGSKFGDLALFTGREQLVFVSAATQAYQIDIFPMMYAVLTIMPRKVEVDTFQSATFNQ